MIERFLRYSLEHKRRITWMAADEKGIRRISGTVTQLEDGRFFYKESPKKKEREMMVCDVLSAAYARGDDGDTLKNEAMEAENGQ